VAFNAYQRTVGDAHSPLTSEEKGRSETGVIEGSAVRPSPHPARVRTPPGLPRRLHRRSLSRKARSRWATIQGARQLDGGSRHALDR
jgi:hypothetical protein